ncbi:NADPH-dependent FMN reductase [Streptomyces rubiginosohelvolus]|uniref:NADPH-dependent FMN reductase n=1 Tax=Streptomyces rubiginosohelvolus TaxID=67362 RepID=UPI0035DF208E
MQRHISPLVQEKPVTDAPLQLAVIVASVRQGRTGHVVSSWFHDESVKHGKFAVDLIDLADTPPPLILGNEMPQELAGVTKKLAAADAFVVVTPEYNHSFPASIKSLIDWHYGEWRAKPVGFVSYGGMASGLRAVEGLRLVFAEMHAVTVRDCVSFGMFTGQGFEEDGRPTDAEGASAAATTLLDQLAWWGGTLREARERTPYPAPQH